MSFRFDNENSQSYKKHDDVVKDFRDYDDNRSTKNELRRRLIKAFRKRLLIL